MASIFYGGKVEMKPEIEENVSNNVMEDEGYPYAIPKVYLEGVGEEYYPQTSFSWDDDSVVLVKGNDIIKYTHSNFVELLAKDEEGNIVWMDGRCAPYSSCWDGEYLNEERGASEYTIEEYDLETSRKKKYKVVLAEETPMNDGDRFKLKDFVDVKRFRVTEEEKFKITNGTLEKYNGFDEDIVIPEGVHSIRYGAFSCSNKEVKSIKIPSTLINLSNDMFTGWKAEHVEVAEDNPKYYSKNGLLIDKQSKTLVWAYKGSDIPADGSIERIGNSAFQDRTDLKNIVIPDSVVAIERCAFENCDSLEEISLPNSITELSGRVLYGCKKLRTVKLPTSIKKIGANAFDGCERLETLVIPNQVECIERYAFYWCTSLKEIVIPNSVVEIGEYAFNGCSALTQVEIPTSITTISTGMFFDCTGLMEMEIPNSVNKIEMKAFQGCTNLKHVDIPNTVVEIGDYAFWECSNLSQIMIPDSVQNIGAGCFFRCISLEDIQLPTRMKLLKRETFKGCVGLKTIELPRGLLKIEKHVFSECAALSFVEIPNGVLEIEDCAFLRSGIVKIHLPDSVKLLNENALLHCPKLCEIDMSNEFYADNEQILGEEVIRDTDGKYVVKESSTIHQALGGFCF